MRISFIIAHKAGVSPHAHLVQMYNRSIMRRLSPAKLCQLQQSWGHTEAARPVFAEASGENKHHYFSNFSFPLQV